MPEALAEQYRSLVRAHIDGLQERFSGSRIDYTLVNTSAPLDHALFSYLTLAGAADESSLMAHAMEAVCLS